MAGPVLDLELEGGRWRLYRDPPRPPPVGVTVGGIGGHALSGQHNSGEPIVYNHLLSTRIFALRMSEVFIHALERTRKVDVALIWIP